MALKVLQDNIRDMIKKFKKMEEPFLSQKGRDLEKGAKWDDFYIEDYCDITFFQRFVWTREVGNVKGLLDALTKLRISRITKQLWDVESAMRSLHRNSEVLDDIDETVYALNEKLSRVVGVRRKD
ncbi:MAG: hypothetical protein M1828_003163 [Chrysothrix sp. TS-e1954]|nr:MAG: hypothetical protein M1828_003163 [Chrysothrix sp. TS-e1954]